jgi:beta-barrel assembly-enhancing protease
MRPTSSRSDSRIRVLLILPLLFLTKGCAALVVLGGAQTGGASSALYTATHVDEIKKTAAAVAKTYQDITPEQEYYIGRAVAATVLHQYPAYTDERANHYVNLVGHAIVEVSEKPETYGGYHFLILDSKEVNAFAAPGGLILVTRGMLRLCKDEDELAAVLAHEISHVQERHALKTIKSERLTKALSMLTAETLKVFGGVRTSLLTQALEGSVGDIASTLMHVGYSREMEREADEKAVASLARVGYNPIALADVLKEMDEHRTGGTLARFLGTHPSPGDRALRVEARVGGTSVNAVPPERKRRFKDILGHI